MDFDQPVIEKFDLPTHCECCRALLQGGATKHADDCEFLALIRENFPNYKQPD